MADADDRDDAPAGGAKTAEEYMADGKVIILLKNAGGAPQLIKRKFKLTAASQFARVVEFLREQLKLKHADPLFLFINSTFQPSPEAVVGDLFKVNGKLVVNYCLTPAWG